MAERTGKLMTEPQARKLTEEIRDNLSQSARLVQKAHAGKVWKALGYSSFEGWLNKELGLSRSRGYQLLMVASVENVLRESFDLADDFSLSDRETKMINDHGVDQFCSEVNDFLDNSPKKVSAYVGIFNRLMELKEEKAQKVSRGVEVPDPVDENEIAANFFNAFRHNIVDVLDPDVLDQNHYRRMIEELSAAIENIDKTLDDYLKAGDEK